MINRNPAYRAGIEAWYKGDFNNPHWPNTIAHKEWEAGQNTAYTENLKLITEEKKNG